VSILTSIVSAAAHAVPATRAGRLLVLIYHRVHERPDPMFPGEVDAARFDGQMQLVRRHCNPVALDEGVEQLRAGSLPDRAVAVTFDDGYADNATVALPILQRHRVPATFFVATGFLDGGRMWNDSLIEALRRAPDGPLDLADLGLGTLALGPEESRGAVAGRLLAAVKHLPPADRQARVDQICARVGPRLPDDLMMSSAQVRQLAEAGMAIGAHTVSHPILCKLSQDEARAEIERGRADLERIVGHPIRAFAYPNGRPGDDYTLRDRGIVEDLGFDFAVSTRWGAATAGSDRYQLPRFTPWDREPSRWLARLLLAFRNAA
jgi:peptidoglycan/xylan/chitin deacetylase (PgdA/CDA1 family)